MTKFAIAVTDHLYFMIYPRFLNLHLIQVSKLFHFYMQMEFSFKRNLCRGSIKMYTYWGFILNNFLIKSAWDFFQAS